MDVEIGVLTCSLGEHGEAPASNAPSGGQTRDALCTFKPKSGPEETYAGRFQGVSISAEQKGALIWRVKSASGALVEPGLLQQSYASDPTKPALHSMADKSEGSASATGKPTPAGFVILGVELKLKSTSG